MTNKLPPHNLEAEMATLGGCLIDNDQILPVSEILKGGEFYQGRHNIIWAAMLDLTRQQQPVDFLTLTSAIDEKYIKMMGGEAYITQLLTATPTSINTEHYARIVESEYVKRCGVDIGSRIVELSYNGTEPDDLIAEANQLVSGLTRNGQGAFSTVTSIASELYDDMEQWAKEPIDMGEVRGLAVYFRSIDYVLDGIDRGELVIWCGRPGQGKSALMFDIARRLGQKGKRVLIFSLEMTRKAIVSRWASAISGVSTRRVRHGILPIGKQNKTWYKQGNDDVLWWVTDSEFSAYMKAVAQIGAGIPNVWIDDRAGLACSEIRASASRKHRELDGLDLIIVDHGGKIKSESRRGENTAKTEGRKAGEMKNLAKELCPVFLAWQLNRGPEGRTDKRPVIADIRDTGEVEQDADRIMGIYRDEYYNPHTPKLNQMEIKALKQREGVMNHTATVYFNGPTQRFGDLQT